MEGKPVGSWVVRLGNFNKGVHNIIRAFVIRVRVTDAETK